MPKLTKRGPGRPKGSRNKATVVLREAILDSFDRVGRERYLVKMAHDEPKAYLQLLGKVLPAEMNVKGQIEHRDAGPVDVRQLSRAILAAVGDGMAEPEDSPSVEPQDGESLH